MKASYTTDHPSLNESFELNDSPENYLKALENHCCQKLDKPITTKIEN